MKEKTLEFSFAKRTLLYGAAGVCGVSVDAITFWLIGSTLQFVPLAVLNIVTYSLGTSTSFQINKELSFRSRTHRLSFSRFYLTSLLGMLISTLIIMISTRTQLGLLSSKIIATILAIITQYAVNSKFSVVSR